MKTKHVSTNQPKTKKLNIKHAKSSFKALRTSYKLAIGFGAIALLANISSFVFVILPTYALVGDALNTSAAINNDLDQLLDRSYFIRNITYGAMAASTLAGAYGVVQDVRSKPKK